MQAPDPIETIMARLMPPALSQDCQLDMEALIDDLAGPETATKISAARWTGRWVIGGGIAAALGALCAVFPFYEEPADPLVMLPSADESPGLVLVSASDRVESMTDEGWREDANGAALHAVRLNVVEENQIRDEETGMVVQISQPREEVLLMPISSF